MAAALLGLVLDSSSAIAAERSKQSVAEFVESILRSHGPLDLSALEQGYAVLTRNLRRFQKIPNLYTRN